MTDMILVPGGGFHIGSGAGTGMVLMIQVQGQFPGGRRRGTDGSTGAEAGSILSIPVPLQPGVADRRTEDMMISGCGLPDPVDNVLKWVRKKIITINFVLLLVTRYIGLSSKHYKYCNK